MKKQKFLAACLRATEAAGPAALSTLCVGIFIINVDMLFGYVFTITFFTWVIAFIFYAFIFPEPKSDGFLRIDTSNPDRDIYRLELSDAIDSLAKKSSVKFTVDTNADLSSK